MCRADRRRTRHGTCSARSCRLAGDRDHEHAHAICLYSLAVSPPRPSARAHPRGRAPRCCSRRLDRSSSPTAAGTADGTGVLGHTVARPAGRGWLHGDHPRDHGTAGTVPRPRPRSAGSGPSPTAPTSGTCRCSTACHARAASRGPARGLPSLAVPRFMLGAISWYAVERTPRWSGPRGAGSDRFPASVTVAALLSVLGRSSWSRHAEAPECRVAALSGTVSPTS